MPETTAHKALAAFITSLVALVSVFGVSTGWITPSMIDMISVVGGALLTAAVTYLVPNKPKA
jgi:VIT1/CCC1 family predicted Fe2+/Mn2+ transporter